MIKNLSQLKKHLTAGTEFEIINHCRPECVGEIRKVTIENTQGLYSIIPNEPQSKATLANDGRGSWLSWSKARFWDFSEDGICSLYNSDEKRTEDYLIISIKIKEN
ncbi:MAG: hypothetical protein RR162_00115 [Oscillospiraceae bacterium]